MDSVEREDRQGQGQIPLMEAGRQEAGRQREWYVRLENIHVPTTLRGYRRITTTEDGALLSTVMSTYAFDERIRSRLQLWSSPFRVRPYARRLDGMDVIPTEYLFVYVRMV